MLFSLPSVLACALLAHLSSARSDQVVLSGNPPLADGPASDALALDEHGRDTFEGYSVVRFNVSSPEKRQELVRFAEVRASPLASLSPSPSTLTLVPLQLHHLDIWAHHSASADVLLPPHLPLSSAAFDSLTASLPEHSTFIANVGHHITYPSTSSSSSSSLAFGRKKRKQRKPTPAPESPNSNRTVIPIDIPFHDSYHQVDAFFDFLIDLEETLVESSLVSRRVRADPRRAVGRNSSMFSRSGTRLRDERFLRSGLGSSRQSLGGRRRREGGARRS